MAFHDVLDHHFPNAMPAVEFVTQTYRALVRHGFSEANAIACVGVCRDELTHPLVDKIERVWGEAFNFSSLAGMLFLGKTGFSAAHHHAPTANGRERYVYYVLPHIAIGPQGEIGRCGRPGRSEPSNACGALIAFQQELASGHVKLELDPDDIEQSLLKQRLFRRLTYGDVPGLITLTYLAHAVIREDLERMIALTVDPARSDYAVLTGIQIHGPDGADYVWPGTLYAVVSAQRYEFEGFAS